MFWGAKKIFKDILATALKSYIKWLLQFFFFFFKEFEKVEKTGIISTKFSLRCTPSVILGLNQICSHFFFLAAKGFGMAVLLEYQFQLLEMDQQPNLFPSQDHPLSCRKPIERRKCESKRTLSSNFCPLLIWI